MQIVVKSRADAERENPLRVPHLIISIRDPDAPETRPLTNDSTLAVLRLAFDDLDATSVQDVPNATVAYLGRKPQLFSVDDVEAICRMLEVLRPDGVLRHDGVLVHCEAGISRSAGVAAALAAFFNGDDRPYFEARHSDGGRCYVPNRRVYRMLLIELESRASHFSRTPSTRTG